MVMKGNKVQKLWSYAATVAATVVKVEGVSHSQGRRAWVQMGKKVGLDEIHSASWNIGGDL
jgi:hypothetical protein